jgi:cytidylate kinase
MLPLIVAIDGPSGVGKSTASKLVARALAIPHIDTGAMYRAIALAAERALLCADDESPIAAIAERARIEFIPGEDNARVLLDGKDVTELIRTPEMSMAASDVSKLPGVRRVLVRLQQEMGRRAGGVLEGRDIGTKVFPDTPHKFFLTARPEVRAGRRFRELQARGTSAETFDRVLRDTLWRDEQDSTRADSPLSCDDSYQVIDTSELTVSDVVERIVNSVKASQSNSLTRS